MKNITVAVSDAAYHRARVWAAEHDTSVSAVVAFLIQHLSLNPAALQFPAPSNTANPADPANSAS